MNRAQANKWLADQGYPELEVDKAEGIWYVVGGHENPKISWNVERCLHVVRLEDITEALLRAKLDELTEKGE